MLKLKRVLVSAQNVWTVIGLTLALLLVLEGSLTVLYRIRDQIGPKSQETVDPRTEADGYQGVSWAEDYFIEFLASGDSRWEPYVYWRRKPFTGKYININNEGIRYTWNGSEPHDGTAINGMNIYMFGGSTLWGTGARDEFTVPSYLSKLLFQAGCNVTVTNFGESGYVNTQEVIVLLRLLQEGSKPDIVVFYDGVNDAYSTYQSGAAGFPQNEGNREEDFNLTRDSKRAGDLSRIVLSNFVKRLSLYRLASSVVGRMQGLSAQRANAARDDDKLASDTEQVYAANMEIVEQLGQHWGFIPIFYWQPVIYSKDRLTPYEQGQATASKDIESVLRSAYGHVRSSAALARRSDFHNLDDVLNGYDKPFYIDFAHLTEYGNKVVAERMFDDIVKVLIAKQ